MNAWQQEVGRLRSAILRVTNLYRPVSSCGGLKDFCSESGEASIVFP